MPGLHGTRVVAEERLAARIRSEGGMTMSDAQRILSMFAVAVQIVVFIALVGAAVWLGIHEERPAYLFLFCQMALLLGLSAGITAGMRDTLTRRTP